MPDRLRCVVERITCQNPDNGYSVIKCTAKGNIESYEETLAATVCGIEKYLGSGLVHGSGLKFAKRIVSPFGADTLTVIKEEPDRLIEAAGTGGRHVAQIKKRGWKRRRL